MKESRRKAEKASSASTAVRVLPLLLASIVTTACGNTVRWEEEVVLNNGETISVRRERAYTRQIEQGNPFFSHWAPAVVQTIEFSWRGKTYEYTGDARLMLLAIDSSGTPVLVARADENMWHAQHHYGCTRPFYVELVPDGTGRQWSWPSALDTWLYRMPANLMVAAPPREKPLPRYTVAQVAHSNTQLAPGNRSLVTIDPMYEAFHCARKAR